jgi:hypothetical protein
MITKQSALAKMKEKRARFKQIQSINTEVS